MKNIKCLHIMGCSLAINDDVRKAIEKALDLSFEFDKMITFDPNIRVELGLSEKYLKTINRIPSKISIILSGERELLTITGKRDLTSAINYLEVDSTGAGDCFDAGFIVSVLEGHTVEEALISANIIGALSVTKKGPMEGVVDRDILEKLLKG